MPDTALNAGDGGETHQVTAIGHNADAKPLLDKAGVEPDEGVTDLVGFVDAAKRRYWDREASVRTLA